MAAGSSFMGMCSGIKNSNQKINQSKSSSSSSLPPGRKRASKSSIPRRMFLILSPLKAAAASSLFFSCSYNDEIRIGICWPFYQLYGTLTRRILSSTVPSIFSLKIFTSRFCPKRWARSKAWSCRVRNHVSL